MNQTIAQLMERKSVRVFTDQPISPEKQPEKMKAAFEKITGTACITLLLPTINPSGETRTGCFIALYLAHTMHR